MSLDKIIQQHMAQQMPPAVVAGGPINDIQLIALVASSRHEEEPVSAVAWATEIVIEAILQAGGGKLQAMLQQRLREQSAMEE